MRDATPDPSADRAAHGIRTLRRALAARFNLLADKAADTTIERRVRDGVELRGATPWILMFAILVASIGLNVNSTALIIGAMLISPLMGPIMGAGLGVAVYDFPLVRRSLLNLLIATVISLVVSALYFALTPLDEAQSELLARTSPTLWDVLIALFGGMAGVIGITREEKSNVVPGVAIATALMPPLCTAGYGIGTGNWAYFGGAFYLYSINCVFIALATAVGLRLVRLPVHAFVDARTESRVRNAMLVVALATALPSVYLAVKLVRQELFRSAATQFVRREFVFDDAYVADTRIDPGKRVIEVSLIGIPVAKPMLRQIEGKLAVAGLPDSKIVVHQAGENEKVDVTALKSSLLSDLYKESQLALQQKETELAKTRGELAARDRLARQAPDIAAELRTMVPQVASVVLSQGVEVAAEGATAPAVQLLVRTTRSLSEQQKGMVDEWFAVRSKLADATVAYEVVEVDAPAR